MAATVNVNLPIIVTFLLLYSLKRGSILICFWTLLRSFFCFVFFIWSSMDVFLPFCSSGKGATLRQKPITQDDDYCTNVYYLLYLSYTSMIVIEAMLFLYSITLAIGIYTGNIAHITHYLVCRFITWCLEVILLTLITIVQDESKGWYMIFLMLIILELYGFVVVYSFLNELCELIARRKHCCQGGT
ncbi:unnamed protein product [Arctia plantaginis]|uniref:Uncharacterized protein n=1 Tax=Arctia plantaginis TaxID=874455 RepID=A0A8S0Z5N1_ARCPL|nr:unnamed protein product [Arctia plantaginis]CAB3228288.1 unnamed protein product [Arctia plantaginis]